MAASGRTSSLLADLIKKNTSHNDDDYDYDDDSGEHNDDDDEEGWPVKLVIVRHDDIVDDDNESDDDDDYPGRWRSMATGKVTSGTKKKTSQIPIGRVGLGEVLHNIFYLYECRKQSMCSLIVSRRNSIYRCTPETLQLRSGSHNCYRSGELHIIRGKKLSFCT